MTNGDFTYSAEFSFDGLICSLITRSSGDLQDAELVGHEKGLIYTEGVPFHNRDLIEDLGAQDVLYHELVHYWQVLSNPTLQFQFLVYLAKAGAHLKGKGVSCFTNVALHENEFGLQDLYHQIEAPNSPEYLTSLNNVRVRNLNEREKYDWLYSAINKNLAFYELNEIGNPLWGDNVIIEGRSEDSEPRTTMPMFDRYPRDRRMKMYPQFGVTMFLDVPCKNETYSREDADLMTHYMRLLNEERKMEGMFGRKLLQAFPFTPQGLLESAAHISEILFSKGKLPDQRDYFRHVIQHGSVLTQMYLGPWEFWRRIHKHKYDSLQELAHAFISCVELSLTSGVVGPIIADSESIPDIYIPSYRFGKLAYLFRDEKPLVLHDEDPAKSTYDWHNAICMYTGIENPKFVLEKMIISLSKILLANSANSIEYPVHRLSGSSYEVYVKKVNENIDSITGIGTEILKEMINACVYRIENYGKFTRSHLCFGEVRQAFPLPILNVNGAYYLGVNKKECLGTRISVNRNKLAIDAINVYMLRGIIEEDLDCRFRNEFVKCSFQALNDFCPLDRKDHKSLNENTTQLGRCHFKEILETLGHQNPLNQS